MQEYFFPKNCFTEFQSFFLCFSVILDADDLKNGDPTLTVLSAGHVLSVFVNGQLQGELGQHECSIVCITYSLLRQLKKSLSSNLSNFDYN